jgi:hypothetical protein
VSSHTKDEAAGYGGAEQMTNFHNVLVTPAGRRNAELGYKVTAREPEEDSDPEN